jgi:signal transduction histidine kinase
MRFSASLTNRIFVACTLLAMLSLSVALSFVNARVSSEAEAELRRGLTEAAAMVDQHRVSLTDTFTRFARLIADLPKLKAAVETQDPPTVQPLASEYLKQANADLLVVTGRSGEVLGSVGIGTTADLPAAVQNLPGRDEVATFSPHPRGVLQVISVPISLEGAVSEILGRLTVGFFLDERLAGRFKGLTGSDIAFGAGRRILASTLPLSSPSVLADVMQVRDISSVEIGGEEFLVLTRALATTGEGSSASVAPADAPVVMVLRSRAGRLRFLSTIRAGLVGALIITLLMATIVSYAVARTMTLPLTAITKTMRDVAATGDLTRKVVLRSRPWDDEDARLLAGAFNALTESIARFQREAAQKERLSSLGRLSTVIAHEVRNPLMIIKASLRSLRRPSLTSSELREAVVDIEEETVRLNRIVTEVLDFARPIRFEFGLAHLNDLCRASVAATWAGEADFDVRLDLDESLPPIETDAERLRTALINILTNARQAVDAVSPRATGTDGVVAMQASEGPAVVLATHRKGDSAIIGIRDRGLGIPPEDIGHIFDPFFTTRRTGTGLGLPIVKNVVDGLGGTISVTSRPGFGTDIQIELPIARSGTPS